MLCADFLLNLEKECMLVGSMLFSPIVNACVYVIDAVVEETSLVAAVHALHHVVVVALLVALLVACHVADAQHGATIGAPVPLAGHANHRGSRRSALRAIAAAAAELDAVISAASADTTAVWLSG